MWKQQQSSSQMTKFTHYHNYGSMLRALAEKKKGDLGEIFSLHQTLGYKGLNIHIPKSIQCVEIPFSSLVLRNSSSTNSLKEKKISEMSEFEIRREIRKI